MLGLFKIFYIFYKLFLEIIIFLFFGNKYSEFIHYIKVRFFICTFISAMMDYCDICTVGHTRTVQYVEQSVFVSGARKGIPPLLSR